MVSAPMPGMPVERRPVERRHARSRMTLAVLEQAVEAVALDRGGQLGGGALGAPRQPERGLDHAGEDGDVVLVADAGGTVQLLAGAQHGTGDVDGVHPEGEHVGEGVGAVRRRAATG